MRLLNIRLSEISLQHKSVTIGVAQRLRLHAEATLG